MANICSFGTYVCLFAHQIRFHFECNTLFNNFSWFYEYHEPANQIKVVMELFKMQLYLSLGTNIQDTWFDSNESYFIRQEHAKEPMIEEDDGILQEKEQEE